LDVTVCSWNTTVPSRRTITRSKAALANVAPVWTTAAAINRPRLKIAVSPTE
jgi:hypothetical protein